MEPICITVCAGTACAVMGGSDLLLLEEDLPERFRGRVRIRGARCLEVCHAGRCEEAPYALIDGRPLARATRARLLEHLDRLI